MKAETLIDALHLKFETQLYLIQDLIDTTDDDRELSKYKAVKRFIDMFMLHLTDIKENL